MASQNKPDFNAFFQRFDPAKMAQEYQKLLDKLPSSGFDLSAAIKAQEKVISSMAQTNDTVTAGIQSLIQKQSDVLQETISEGVEIIKEMASAQDAGFSNNNVAQVEAAIAKSMQDFKEISTMTENLYKEIASTVETRISEATKEFSEAIAKAQSKE